MLRNILLVGLGGSAGSILRYLTSVFVQKYFQPAFPYATFTANILGCLLIGFLIGTFEKHEVPPTDLRLLLITGFCGGYTTFSAFAAENIQLLQSGNSSTAFIYIGISILFCLFAVWSGMAISRI